MRVRVVRPRDLGSAETALWWNFQQSTPQALNPFMSLTYVQAVDRHRANARVAVVEDHGEIAAFLPFELHAHGMGMPIGYPMNNLQGFIGSGLPVDARWVVKKARLRGWRFTSAPVDQHALVPFHYEGTTVPCPVINLAKGDLSYISGRSKARRAMEREFGTVSLEWNNAQPAQIDRLIEWKSRKYHGTSLLFSDPAARGIVEELAASDNEDCRGVVSVLFAGEQPAAVHLGLLGPQSLAGWFMSYDPGLNRFAPGMMLWLPLAKAAGERGVGQIDLGAGQDTYKFGLSNDSYMVAGGAVWISRAEAIARKGFRRLRALSQSREVSGRRTAAGSELYRRTRPRRCAGPASHSGLARHSSGG
jgi:CelD/BcsL family acetyltransferase involved in cellulose biosynthesis